MMFLLYGGIVQLSRKDVVENSSVLTNMALEEKQKREKSVWRGLVRLVSNFLGR